MEANNVVFGVGGTRLKSTRDLVKLQRYSRIKHNSFICSLRDWLICWLVFIRHMSAVTSLVTLNGFYLIFDCLLYSRLSFKDSQAYDGPIFYCETHMKAWNLRQTVSPLKTWKLFSTRHTCAGRVLQMANIKRVHGLVGCFKWTHCI